MLQDQPDVSYIPAHSAVNPFDSACTVVSTLLHVKAGPKYSSGDLLCRPVQEEASAEVSEGNAEPAASAIVRDPATQPLWSPDTPEYTPQYTCQCQSNDEDDAEDLQGSSSNQMKPGGSAPQASVSDALVKDASAVGSRGKQGYGSSSMAPFAFKRTGR